MKKKILVFIGIICIVGIFAGTYKLVQNTLNDRKILNLYMAEHAPNLNFEVPGEKVSSLEVYRDIIHLAEQCDKANEVLMYDFSLEDDKTGENILKESGIQSKNLTFYVKNLQEKGREYKMELEKKEQETLEILLQNPCTSLKSDVEVLREDYDRDRIVICANKLSENKLEEFFEQVTYENLNLKESLCFRIFYPLYPEEVRKGCKKHIASAAKNSSDFEKYDLEDVCRFMDYTKCNNEIEKPLRKALKKVWGSNKCFCSNCTNLGGYCYRFDGELLSFCKVDYENMMSGKSYLRKPSAEGSTNNNNSNKTGKTYDPYDKEAYDNPEDFYDDYSDEFDSFEDAEDEWEN